MTLLCPMRYERENSTLELPYRRRKLTIQVQDGKESGATIPFTQGSEL